MLRLAADENFNGDIVRGLLRRNPKLDIVRVQDVGLSGADDPSVLQWAAEQGRIIVTPALYGCRPRSVAIGTYGYAARWSPSMDLFLL